MINETTQPQAVSSFNFQNIHARWPALEIAPAGEASCPIWEVPGKLLEVLESSNSSRKWPEEFLVDEGRGCMKCLQPLVEATQKDDVKAHPDYWVCPICGSQAARISRLDCWGWL